ncbi:hypothetical protein [Nannocystis pusilla]|uniref:hypothetical protein n=1 Tax=Nannocystis pusilla TaxID=889268 RepID=UPI003B80C946
MDDRLGTLTDLLQQTPSEALWDALCEELALWDSKALAQVALPRVQAELERWPDEVERWADAGPLVTVQRVAGPQR